MARVQIMCGVSQRGLQRLRENEKAVKEINQAQAGGGDERQAQVMLSKDAADARTEDEAYSEGGPQDAEVFSPAVPAR